jgi:CRISPR-associated protein Cas1
VYASGSRNASHPVNAILNYAYAVLQSQVQIKLVSEGYDPMLGIMHYDRDGAPAFVFDMMEPERPKVDRAVLGFLKSEALHPADFTIRADGVVRLNPELARRVAAMAGAVQSQPRPIDAGSPKQWTDPLSRYTYCPDGNGPRSWRVD